MIRTLLKKIYSVLPFKRDTFIILKNIYQPSKNLYQHLHFVGIIKIQIKNGVSFKIKHYGYEVENEIFWNGLYGGWEKTSLLIWTELSEKSKSIFDIGANTGVYSLIAKTTNPDANVYAFEPVERVFEKLSKNNLLNNANIVCLQKAASNFDGTATIYDKATDHTYSVTVNKDTSTDQENSIPVQIDTIRMDTFINQQKIEKIDLIKIDVETHEAEVLEGIGEYLRKFEPTILIEVLSDEIADRLNILIKGIGYDLYNIDESKGLRKVSELSKSDDYNFLVCKPEIAKNLNTLKKLLY